MTKTEVIAMFTIACKDCDSSTASTLFNQSHIQISRELDTHDYEVSIPLTKGEREFAITSTLKKVLTVYYCPTSGKTGWTQLMPTTLQELEYDDAFQKITQQDVPTKYYLRTNLADGSVTGQKTISTNMIGLNWYAPTTTSGGYPLLKISGQVVVNLASGDELPDLFDGYEQLYVYHMAKAFTALVAPENSVYWKKQYDDLLATAKRDIMSREYGIEGTSIRPLNVDAMTSRGW